MKIKAEELVPLMDFYGHLKKVAVYLNFQKMSSNGFVMRSMKARIHELEKIEFSLLTCKGIIS